MKTINEIYKELKQLRDSLEEYIKTNDTSAAKVVLVSNLNIYNDILNQLEESGILEEEKLKDMALKLACRRIDYLEGNEDSEYMTDPFTFILLAKEELYKGE